MAALLEEITTYLASQLAWTEEVELFSYGFPPLEADTAVAIVDGPGRPTLKAAGLAEIGDYDVQVLSRAKEPAVARARSYEVLDALQGLCNVQLTSWFVHFCRAAQAPYAAGYDARSRFEYMNHYRLRATAA